MSYLSKKDFYQLPKDVYLLVTADKFELPVACCDTIKQMSKETGIPFTLLYNAYYRNQTCSGGRYRVYKVDISEPEYDPFNVDDYKLWCDLHNLKPCIFNNLVKYRRICKIYFPKF